MSAAMKHRIYVGKDVHKFSSAHMTIFPDGTKERIHGHNFQVTVAFDLFDVSMQSFLDFAIVKRALDAQCKAWAERLLLPARSPHFRVNEQTETHIDFVLCDKRYVIPVEEVVLLPLENVVVETLAVQFAHEFVPRLGEAISKQTVAGIEVDVSEAAGQGGVYYWTFR
jgi:6-pyruvoyltetrahydropterin/6-carboxytetrahydropterin synthase